MAYKAIVADACRSQPCMKLEKGVAMTDKGFAPTELKRLLLKAGLKQKDIAKKANVSPAAVSLVADGKSKSQRIERIIREEAAKVLENQEE